MPGSPMRWKTADELYADWTAYKELKKNNTVEFATKNGVATRVAPLPITIEGFCAWAKIARSKFYGYKTREGFQETMEIMDMEHEAYINENTAVGAFDSNWHKQYMANKFGYADKSVSVSLGVGGMTDADKQFLNKMAGVLGIGEGAIECDYTASSGETGTEISK